MLAVGDPEAAIVLYDDPILEMSSNSLPVVVLESEIRIEPVVQVIAKPILESGVNSTITLPPEILESNVPNPTPVRP